MDDETHQSILNKLRKRSASAKARYILDNAYGAERKDAQNRNTSNPPPPFDRTWQRPALTTNHNLKSIAETNTSQRVPINENVARFFGSFSDSVNSEEQYEDNNNRDTTKFDFPESTRSVEKLRQNASLQNEFEETVPMSSNTSCQNYQPMLNYDHQVKQNCIPPTTGQYDRNNFREDALDTKIVESNNPRATFGSGENLNQVFNKPSNEVVGKKKKNKKKKRSGDNKSVESTNTVISNEEPKLTLNNQADKGLQQSIMEQNNSVNNLDTEIYPNANRSLLKSEQNISHINKRYIKDVCNETASHGILKNSTSSITTNINLSNEQLNMLAIEDGCSKNSQPLTKNQRKRKTIPLAMIGLNTIPCTRVSEQIDSYYKRTVEKHFNNLASIKSSNDMETTSAISSNINYLNEEERVDDEDRYNRNSQVPNEQNITISKPNIKNSSNTTQSLPISEQVDLYYKRNQEKEFNKTESQTPFNNQSSFKSSTKTKNTSAISSNTEYWDEEESVIDEDRHKRNLQLPTTEQNISTRKPNIKNNSNTTQSLPISEQVDLYYKRNQEKEFNKTGNHRPLNDQSTFKPSTEMKTTSAISSNTEYWDEEERVIDEDRHKRNLQLPTNEQNISTRKTNIKNNSNTTQSLPISEQVDLYYRRNQVKEFNKGENDTPSNIQSSFKPLKNTTTESTRSSNTNYSNEEERVNDEDRYNRNSQVPTKDKKTNSSNIRSLSISEQVDLYYKRNQVNEFKKTESSVSNTSTNEIVTKSFNSLNAGYKNESNSINATKTLSQMEISRPMKNSSNINSLKSAYMPLIDNERPPRVTRKKRILPEPSKCLEKINKILQSADAQTNEINRLKNTPEISPECFKSSNIQSLLQAKPKADLTEPSMYQRAVDKLISLKNSITQSLTKDANTEQKTESIDLTDIDVCLYNMRSIRPNNLILAHSKTDCIFVDKLKDMSFYKQISDGMINMHFDKVYPSQTYAWPHLLRGNSLCIINSAKTGKTWCYLPPICQLIKYRIETARVLSSLGPLAIVLLSKPSEIEMICKYFNILLQNTELKSICVPCFGARDHSAVKMQLLNGCGVLVTTPASLKRLLEDHQSGSLFDSNRLCHFVIDGIDEMINHSSNDLEFVIKKILSIAKKEVLQIVATSCEWTSQLISLLKRANDILLLFGNLLEAAFYAKTNITLKLHSSEMKIRSILKYLESNCSNVNRTLIVCNSEEDVAYVADSLKRCGCVAVGFNKNSSIHILNVVFEWMSKSSFTQVLVCSDVTLSELSKLQNVQTLIHYSLPTTWVAFTNRFATMLKSFHNFIEDSFARTSYEKETRSLILLDENTKEEIVRLVEIMQTHGYNISTEILNVAELALKEINRNKNSYGQQICPILLECGMCGKSNCCYRHELNQCDKMETLPVVGDLRIVVLKVYSPTYFVARLLEHRNNTAEEWQQVCRSSEVSLFLMQLDYHYQNEENLVVNNSPKIDDICIYKSANNFHRGKVIGVYKAQSKDKARMKVTIKLIDIGTTTTVSSDMLYVCDNKFKHFPAQAIDIRLLNVVPYDNAVSWDNIPTRLANKFMTQLKETEVVHVAAKFAFANCIWIDNVYVLNFLKCTRLWVHTDSLKNILIRQKLGAVDTKIESKLRKLGEANNLITKLTSEDTIPNEDKYEESFSRTDAETDIESACNSAGNNSNSTDNYEDTDAMDSRNNEDLNNKLCHSELKPIEKWCQIPLNEFVKVQLGDWKSSDNWSEIYVQLDEPDYREAFMELSEFIEEFINKLKTDTKYRYPDHLLVLSSDCIVRYDEHHLRAKLCRVFKNEVREDMYCFFLCDYACFITVNKDKLNNDFLYETTNEIVDYIPFQAIHCKLNGVDKNCSFINITKEYMFVSAIAKHCNGLLNINSYEVLLYESDSLENVESMKLLNSNNNTNEYFENDNCEIMQPKIGYNEMLQIIQNCLAMDEADIQDNERYEKLKVQPNVTQTKRINKVAHCTDLKESCVSDESIAVCKNKDQSFTDLPALISSYKCPYTLWYQTDVFIFLNITAPDVKKFSIDVSNKTLIFAADLDNEKLLLTLNLFGFVNPHYYCEVRGLNLIVRLVKSVYMSWPRLIEQTCKFPWLSYNINKIDIKENELLQNIEKDDCKAESLSVSESDLDSADENDAYNDLKPKDYVDYE